MLGYDPETGQVSTQTVQHLWINYDNDLIDLTLHTSDALAASEETPPQAAGQAQPPSRAPPQVSTQTQAGSPLEETVHTTAKHPLLTVEQGWMQAGQLQPGMHVLRAEGQVGVVEAVVVIPGAGTMYNLEVSNVHTFEVGLGQWVVHNCGGGSKKFLQIIKVSSRMKKKPKVPTMHSTAEKRGNLCTLMMVQFLETANRICHANPLGTTQNGLSIMTVRCL